MTAENEPRPEERGFGRNWTIREKVLAVGGAAAALAFGIWHYYDKSGDLNTYGPYVQVDPQIDTRTNIGSWNMEKKVGSNTRVIEEFMAAQDLDILLIQEGTDVSAERLRNHLQDKHVWALVTEGKQAVRSGGQALIVVSEQLPKDPDWEVFEGPDLKTTLLRYASGTFNVVESAFAAEVNTRPIEEAFQETRAVLAVTIKTQVRDRLEDVRVITGHISPHLEFKEEQIQKTLEFIKDNMKPGRPTVVCMDWNEDPEPMIQRLSDIGLRTDLTEPTSDDGRVIDFCSVNSGRGKLNLGKTAVYPMRQTDHRPLTIKFDSSNPRLY